MNINFFCCCKSWHFKINGGTVFICFVLLCQNPWDWIHFYKIKKAPQLTASGIRTPALVSCSAWPVTMPQPHWLASHHIEEAQRAESHVPKRKVPVREITHQRNTGEGKESETKLHGNKPLLLWPRESQESKHTLQRPNSLRKNTSRLSHLCHHLTSQTIAEIKYQTDQLGRKVTASGFLKSPLVTS